jgi:hypothetical protein
VILDYIKLTIQIAFIKTWTTIFETHLDFLEESYYVECNNILFIAKATTTLDSKSDQDKFKKIIENVRCVK